MEQIDVGDTVKVNDTADDDYIGMIGKVCAVEGKWIWVEDETNDPTRFLKTELTLISTARDEFTQQLADAIARAERAERQAVVLKAFVEEVAGSAPHSKPRRTYYASTTKFNADTSRWRFASRAVEVLKALEDKAVGDGTDNAPTEAR